MNTWVADVKGLVDILLWKRIQRFPVYRNVAALKVKDDMKATSFEKISDFSRLPDSTFPGPQTIFQYLMQLFRQKSDCFVKKHEQVF